VISSALVFYILAIAAIFVLRVKQPEAERPYKAIGYPLIPALYCVGAAIILIVLFVYQTTATWPGLLIVLTGVPVYFIWRNFGSRTPSSAADGA
jgi:APA family basic amino acid/polyamine antiporter